MSPIYPDFHRLKCWIAMHSKVTFTKKKKNSYNIMGSMNYSKEDNYYMENNALADDQQKM